MPRFGALRATRLLMVLGLWSLPVLAQTPARLPAVPPPWLCPRYRKTEGSSAADRRGSANASDYAGAESLQDLPRGHLQRLGEKPALETDIQGRRASPSTAARIATAPLRATLPIPTDTSKLFLFEKASVKEIDARCLGCHAGGTQHMNAINSEHARNDVSCIACHSPHHGKDSDFMLVKSQPELCYSCHLAKKAEFDMPFHHRVNEGLIQCTDCHNVHGTVKPKQVRTSSSQDQVCFTCHTDKQGPFVFEHQPVKVDGCQSCHLVHGGPNPHMLKLSNVNLLCLQCHTQSSFSGAPGAPSFHNQASFFQSCVLCHSQVHGSNFDPTFFK